MDSHARRQYFQFLMIKVDPAWRGLPAGERGLGKSVFADVLQEWSQKIVLRTYTMVGIRADVDIMLWLIADKLEDFQAFRTQLFRTPMAPYLHTPFSYVAVTKRSIYIDKFQGAPGTLPKGVLIPGRNKFLFVYPFVKKREWYMLSQEERQAQMDEHIQVGRQYPEIRINTTYSFGLDDQEFVVAFEGDDPMQFVDLVMDLRNSKASFYTLRDTPTFTGIQVDRMQLLDALGGASSVETGVAQGDWADRAADEDEFVPVCREEEVPANGGKMVIARGEQVALFRVGENLHAIYNRCSHSRGPLVDGTVCDGVLTCPWHGAQYDLETGADHGLPARGPVPVFEVKVENGVVFVGPVKVQQ